MEPEEWTALAAVVTSFATVVLVVVTAVYVRLTAKINKSSSESAAAATAASEHAERSAETAERALLAEMMPLLVVQIVPPDEWPAGGPGVPFDVPVVNEGRGVALNVRATLDEVEARVPVLRRGESSYFEFPIPEKGGLDPPEYVYYEDAVGNQFRTRVSPAQPSRKPYYETEVERDGDWQPLRHS